VAAVLAGLVREHKPPTLIVWGRNDPFFTVAGAQAYLRDLPTAELHFFDGGHFVLEEHGPKIIPQIDAFLERTEAANAAFYPGTDRFSDQAL